MLSICAFCLYVNLCDVMVFHRSIVNSSGEYMYLQYMCIMLYVKVIWCNGIPYIYFQLEWGVYVSYIYVHSAICDSYLV